MRSLLLLITLALIIISCSKDDAAPEFLSGVSGKWIEKSHRLDTIDFSPTYLATLSGEKVFHLQARPITDPSIIVGQRYFSTAYVYYFEQPNIVMRALTSSSMNYNKFEFRWTTGHKSFIVKRFYNRESLPERLEFIPLK